MNAFAPASADAQLSWQGIGTVSVGGSNAETPDVAMSPRGEAIAVWTRLLAQYPHRLIDATLRPPGGNFSVPGQAISREYESFGPDGAIGANGHAQAVWTIWPSLTLFRVYGASRAPGAGFAEPVPVSGFDGSFFSSETDVDAQGNALALFREAGGRIGAAFRQASSSNWGPREDISQAPTNANDSSAPDMAMDPQGNAAATWVRDGKVEARWRSAGPSGAWGVVNTLSLAGASNARVAMDGQGGALVVWVGVGGVPSAAYRPPGTASTFVNQPVPKPASVIDNPDVAMDEAGNGIMVWQRAGRIEAAVRPAGRGFGAGTPISPAGQTADLPRIAMSSGGSAVAVWRRLGTGNDADRIWATHRAAGGTFGSPVELTDPIAGGDANWPDVAMDSAGNAIATWDRPDAQSVRRIQSRIGVAAGVAPPPPPPPPPPAPPPPPPEPGVPTVTELRLAEPLRRDSAVVLTAETSGPVERLEWNLPTGPDIVARTIGGRLQRSVRFRPRPGGFSVSVRAFGAGRAGPVFTRSLDMPRSRGDSDTKRVLAGLRGNFAVNAVGDEATITGRSSSCAVPTSMQSARLELEGCFTPAEALADIPAGERGVLEPIARELGLPVSDADLMRRAVELTDGYVASAPVALNGNWPVVPRGAASILAFPQANALSSSNAGLRVGGYDIGRPGGFVLDINPGRADIPLPALPRPPSLRSLGRFPLVGDFDVKLVGREAHITSTLKLPSFLKQAGVDVQALVHLRATPDRLILDDMTIGPINVDIGALAVKQFRIAYRRIGNDDEWQGQGRACVISGICLDMVPPNGQVKIRNGNFDFAGASLGFGRPGIPLFTGVNLERIGFGFGLGPTRLTGNARLGFAQLLVIDGRLVLAFPTSQQPFFLRRDEVGGGFPDRLYTYRYTGTTMGVSADAALRLPVIGETPLARAYLLYEYPGYAALGGAMTYAFRDPITRVALISVDGRLDGEFNAGNGRFNVDGHVRGCVVDVICRGVDGNVSNRGMSVCTAVDAFIHEFHVGGAIRWSPFEFIPYLDGCVWGRFREANVRSARRAQAGGAYTVQVARGAPSRMTMLNGAADAPRVRVTGPGGQVLESPGGSGLVATRDTTIRILRSTEGRFVAVGLARARPGTYRIEPMAGSAPVVRARVSTALPPASVSARVRGSGIRRALHYRVAKRPDQTVTFHDVGRNGSGRQIGAVRGGGRGILRFSAAPGSAPRAIKARFEINGVPAEEITVARFRPPSPRLATPARVRTARLRRNRLRISWNRVVGAGRYEILLTASNGRQRFATTRARTVVVRGVPAGLGGRVNVRAVDQLRQGRPATARFRAVGRRRTAMRALLRCRGRTHIVCSRR